MVTLVLCDSIDPPGNSSVKKADKSTDITFQDITFINNATYEHGEEDREGFTKLVKSNPYANSSLGLSYSNRLFQVLALHPKTVTDLFESISADLPSPPPKV